MVLKGNDQIIFLGTGTSEGIPIVSCLINENKNCFVCKDAYMNKNSKNKRRNTSIMIRIHTLDDKKKYKNIMIDCGKFFWQSAMEYFPKYNIDSIDAILLSHFHVDACYGIDDLVF
jgi:phosphoribosyl 1,2-cyclic phosphodiesterase